MNLMYKSIIEEMSLEEKARMMSGDSVWETIAYPQYGIPSMIMSDGPHGMRRQSGKGDHLGLNASIPATCFPTAATIANSWDEKLCEEVGAALAEEAVTMGVNVILGPGLNIKRSPLCGRNFEYFSEDPYLSGKMAAAYIRGIQLKGIAACPKHFAVNSQEYLRMTNDSIIDERTLREIYTTGFEIAVKEGKAKTIMSSYNKINGIYANENAHLLKDILVKEWGFDGCVISDWGGSNDHALGVKNGSHLEMPGTKDSGMRDILKAIKEGTLSEDELDERLDELLKLIFETHNATQRAKGESFHVEEHLKVARKAAEESIVLLKNENILPLQKKCKVAVIGDFAKNPRYQGAGSSLVNPTKNPESFLDAMKKDDFEFAGYEQGYIRNRKPDQKLMDSAISLAKKAEVIIIFAGLDEVSESEGVDRKDMKMPLAQNELIQEISKVNPNIVVVLSAGSVIEIPWINDVKAVIHGYLGGQAGASAMYNVLVGKSSPSGRLNETYPIQYEDTPTFHYFPGKEKTSEYRESVYVGYRYYTTINKKVLFPFGYGLSYTKFKYSQLRVNEDGVCFKLKNVGNRKGSEVAQLYVGKESESVFRPIRELKGFKRITLEPGEEKDVHISFDDKTFRFFDIRDTSWQVEDGEYSIMIGINAEEIVLKDTIYIKGTIEKGPYSKQQLSNYFDGKIENINNEEFEALYGKEIPNGSWQKEFDINDPVCQLRYSKGILGRIFCFVLRRIIRFSEWRGKQNLNALFNYNMPIRGYAKMTGGFVTMDMAKALTEMANGHRIHGTAHLIKATIIRK